MDKPIKHVLGLSGGKDSSALALYTREKYPEIDFEYFFTDTGKELPEVYEYLDMLEGFLGKPVLRLNGQHFDYWLVKANGFLPSPKNRWCTAYMKLKPFEDWLKPWIEEGIEIRSYVAIRSDEEYREAYLSKYPNLKVVMPFQDDHINKEGVFEILKSSGIGIPKYYKWRSRSGCTFCFFQQKIEWVRLLEHHPEAFEEAKAYEKYAADNDSPFTWIAGEPLTELEKPARIAQIEADYKRRVIKLSLKKVINPLHPVEEPMDIDEVYGATGKACWACHK